jgi:autoinducer 2-binding protein LuxP
MKKNIPLLILFFLSCLPCTAYTSSYLTMQEFYRLHPEQLETAADFNALVRQKGEPTLNRAQKKAVQIAFIYPGNQVSDYWRRSIQSFTGRMDEIGIKYTVSEYFTKVNEIRVQEKQLQEALSKDLDYLIYTLNVMKHRKLIERTLARGKPKLILQNITTPLRDWENNQPFLYVGFDHAAGSTEYLAKHLIKKTGGKGKYAMLYHSQGYVSEMRGDTFIRYLKDNSSHRLVASYYTDGNRTKSKEATLEILQEHDVKFIYACATDTAFGAIDALRQTGKLEQVIINGWGGGSEEIAALQAGDLDYTVMRMNDDNGIAMAEAIRLDLEGNSHMVPTVFSGEFVLVDKKIDKDRLDQLKARAFRYSGY